MTRTSEHIEWLNLVDRSGPFVVPAVLEEVFPQGFDKVETPGRQRLRAAYDEWRDAVDEGDPALSDLHGAWVRIVLRDALEYENGVLASRAELGEAFAYRAPEHGVRLAPDFAVRGDDGAPRLLIAVHPPDTDLEKPLAGDGWPASAAERMTLLCRANGVRVGLVTNGEQWMLVNAPVGGTSGYASWFARLWWQEPVTLRAFVSLLGVRRCFGPPDESLDQLLERSLAFQEEVTDTLGQQVRRAVEVLIQALGRADEDRNGELLKDVSPTELYEAGLTVMMRLVFILCAEERSLLLLGDPVYDQHYAISTLRARLREDESQHGPEVIERRHDAWSRMLSVFRAVFGGIKHEALRMPALGGSLFDPDRFPFLEGRAKGTSWREEPASPLPIDNRTVLLLLSALQLLEQRAGAQLLSYRALDVEQIGHVYEGLLEYTVARVPAVTVGLIGSQKIPNPSIELATLEAVAAKGTPTAAAYLADLTGRSLAAIDNAIARGGRDADLPKLIQACVGDGSVAERVKPFSGLIRTDSWGSLLVYRAGSFAITRGVERRETGTHYTPRSLTEAIVERVLQPIVYTGPAEGKPREQWVLKGSAELLELKICDPAMGSGAFLVQACRYLGERLVEAWANEEEAGHVITSEGAARDGLGDRDPLSRDPDDRLLFARRLVAERCLYGVDANRLAVELAKLSIWLVTLAKGRPFGFLDHNLRHGDSLLGIWALDQLTELKLEPSSTDHQPRLFGRSVRAAVDEAISLRKRLRDIPSRDIRDVQSMARLDTESRRAVEAPTLLADAFVATLLQTGGKRSAIEAALDMLAMKADLVLADDEATREDLECTVRLTLADGVAPGRPPRRPFHWPLQFPEVFTRGAKGFDAIVGNPPFMYGKNVSGALGDRYSAYLVTVHPWASKNADVCVHFFLRAFALLRDGGAMGMLATKTIAEGDSRESGLDWILDSGGTIYAANPNEVWPGKASVITSRVHVFKGRWHGRRRLSDREVAFISSYLNDQDLWTPQPLRANAGIAFQGSTVLGDAHVLTPDEAARLIVADPPNREVLFPFMNGDELNSDPEQRPVRWVVNFFDWGERPATRYAAVYELLRARAYPDRLERSKKKSYAGIMSSWWRFWRVRPDLYHAIGRGRDFEKHVPGWDPSVPALQRVLVIARTSKTGAFVWVPNEYVMSDATVVFARSNDSFFAVLQSSLHICYAWFQSSKMKADLRYSHSDCFETFPLPLNLDGNADLEHIGERFHSARAEYLVAHQIGLTDFYHRFHDPTADASGLPELRRLQTLMDQAVAEAYGFDDICLDHDFHSVAYLPEEDRVRFTISEDARLEVLRRLTNLNRERHEAECAQASEERGTNTLLGAR